MRTQETIIYKYSELSDKAKEKAKDYFIENWLEPDEWADLDFHKQELEEKGFCDSEIFYSGFWSQGDGASFTCKGIDLELFMKTYNMNSKTDKMLLQAWNKGWITDIKVIRNDFRYYHEKTMTVDWSIHLREKAPYKIENAMDELEQAILEIAQDEARAIYKNLEENYEYHCSDEYISEAYDNNDTEFTEDGKIFK